MVLEHAPTPEYSLVFAVTPVIESLVGEAIFDTDNQGAMRQDNKVSLVTMNAKPFISTIWNMLFRQFITLDVNGRLGS